MAVLPAWPAPLLDLAVYEPFFLDVAANAPYRRTASPTLETYAKPLRSPYDRPRSAIRLNVPTVAALRKRSVIATPPPRARAPNMPDPAQGPSQAIDVRVSEPTPRGPSTDPPTSHPPAASDPRPAGSRRGSATQHSASAGSSPTSTISTLDSALTGSSPSSSPESPTTSLPMHAFDGKSHETVVESPLSSNEQALVSPPPGSDGDGPGNRRPRNVRNLSINTRGIGARPATIASLAHAPEQDKVPGAALPAASGNLTDPNAPNSLQALERAALSEPASPSFIVPQHAQPRKRRSKLGLTIATPDSLPNGAAPGTPAFALSGLAARRGGASSGSTPAFKRFSALKSSESNFFSPAGGPSGGMSLPPVSRGASLGDKSLPTPAFAPAGGMSLPPLGGSRDRSPARPLSRGPMSGMSVLSGVSERPALTLSSQRSFEGGAAESVIHHTVEHTPDFPPHDLPLSRELKSPSYPNGPACIYSPSVFLYHQPTADEARNFDVVINVAKEVPNPFHEEAGRLEDAQAAKGYQDASVQCDLLDAPPLVPLDPGKRVETVKDDEPATPKASSPATNHQPEYIHLPWEHNSHVYEEWLATCELIDDRVREGKKVLVHCQLGVSRSASLIVAYGLYKNPSLSPDEAREQAKKQSRWIDLNMHFMYELGDFKKILLRQFPDAATGSRATGPPALSRSTTEVFMPRTAESLSAQPPDDGRRASSAERGLQHLHEEDESAPASAPVHKTWTAEESAARHAEMYNAAAQAGDRNISTIPESGAGEEEGSDPTPVREASPAAPAVASASPRSVPRLATPSPPQRPLGRAPAPKLPAPAPAPGALPLRTPPPRFAASISDPAKDLTDLAQLRFSRTAQAPAPALAPPAAPADLASPTASTFTDAFASPSALQPPRTIRPMPSLPGGFTSMRRQQPVPALTLRTQPLPAAASISPPATLTHRPAPRANRPRDSPPPAAAPMGTSPSGAPQLPTLDLGGGSLLSPRSTAFAGVPFKRGSLAGDLAGLDWEAGAGASPSTTTTSVGWDELRSPTTARPPQAKDPRSPPQQSAGAVPEVLRSIDGVL